MSFWREVVKPGLAMLGLGVAVLTAALGFGVGIVVVAGGFSDTPTEPPHPPLHVERFSGGWMRMHDVELGVTCWVYGSVPSCVPDKMLTLVTAEKS